jgi:uncharacterized protein (DUF2237 family)
VRHRPDDRLHPGGLLHDRPRGPRKPHDLRRRDQAYEAGSAAPVVLAATHQRALEVVPLEWLCEHGVDVPDDLGGVD